MDVKKCDTLEEKRTWIRFAWELGALEYLIAEIICDKEYQRIAGRKLMGSLKKASVLAARMRMEGDDLSISRGVPLVGPDLFYGCLLDHVHEAVKRFREELKAEVSTVGSRVYNLTEGDVNGDMHELQPEHALEFC